MLCRKAGRYFRQEGAFHREIAVKSQKSQVGSTMLAFDRDMLIVRMVTFSRIMARISGR
jgi:hypothetical protein